MVAKRELESPCILSSFVAKAADYFEMLIELAVLVRLWMPLTLGTVFLGNLMNFLQHFLA
jgi:hypothetical protein